VAPLTSPAELLNSKLVTTVCLITLNRSKGGQKRQKGKNMATANRQQPRLLLSLPREIRDQIYHYLIHPYGEIDLTIGVGKYHPYQQRRGYYYYLSRALQPHSSPRFRLLDLVLACRQIYEEATPLFYSTNAFMLSPEYTVDFLTSLTPVTRSLIRSWLTSFRSDGKPDWVGIRHYLQHQTNIKRILITLFHRFGDTYRNSDIWEAPVQEFLGMPKLQSLVLLGFGGTAFTDDVVALVKPHRVSPWKQRRWHFQCDTGLEIVKAE
jgi:hypothetical protein